MNSFTENQLASNILDSAFEIHKELGPGLFESVYENVLTHKLTKQGLKVEQQKPIPVNYADVKLEIGFRLDLLVNEKVIVELKSVESVSNVHKKQLLTYLKLSKMKLGLLLNFNVALLKNGITRIVNGL